MKGPLKKCRRLCYQAVASIFEFAYVLNDRGHRAIYAFPFVIVRRQSKKPSHQLSAFFSFTNYTRMTNKAKLGNAQKLECKTYEFTTKFESESTCFGLTHWFVKTFLLKSKLIMQNIWNFLAVKKWQWLIVSRRFFLSFWNSIWRPSSKPSVVTEDWYK